MPQIVQVVTDDQKHASRDLLREYLAWLISAMNSEYEANIPEAALDGALEQAMLENGKFAPPEGRMLLAYENDTPAGLICLRKIHADTGEVKRMYVRSEFRGKGVGKALIERLCDEARQIGYAKIRLDSAPFMRSAHALYRANGFYDIDSYPESEVPAEYYANWLFMERML